MGDIEEIYDDLDADVSLEEFEEAVEEKVAQMGGLADEETAALLVAHEYDGADGGEVDGIAEIEPGMEEVQFQCKVTGIGDLRTFERDEGEGRVINVEVADETGSVRVSFWDEKAEAVADGQLEVGDVLRVQGYPKDGFNGVEVSADRAEPDDADIDVQIHDIYRVADLSLGLSDVTLRGKVLDTDPIRTFDRDDGSEGRVANVALGDETGRIRVTLWDERADRAEEVDVGTNVEVVDGYTRERDGDLELHVGSRGDVQEIDEDVEYVPDATPIAELEIGETVDIAGIVRSADPVRTFDRDDGSEGQVRNVRVQDESGDIRVALWGEKADVDVAPGDEIQLADVEIQDGWQDDLEASAGWRSTVTVLADEGSAAARNTELDGSEQETGRDAGLAAFGDGSDPGDGNEAGNGDETGDESDVDASDDGPIEFTGMVVQTGSPAILDSNGETMTVETDAELQLGEEVTARGSLVDGRLDADEVF